MNVQLKIRTEHSHGQTFAPIGRVIERLQEIGTQLAWVRDYL